MQDGDELDNRDQVTAPERCPVCLGTTRVCSRCERPESQCGCVALIPVEPGGSEVDWVSDYNPVICDGCNGTGVDV